MSDQFTEPEPERTPPELADIPRMTLPLIRPVDVPAHMGRAYALAGSDTWVRVTPRGHWRVAGPRDEAPGTRRVCRGCGGAWLVCLLEDAACPKPASHQDVASALLGRRVVAA